MEENNINVAEQATETTKVLIAMLKKRGTGKILVDNIEEYAKDYKVDGVAIKKSEDEGIILSLTEALYAFGGSSQDMDENDKRRDISSPSMTTLDGDERTDFLIGWYGFTEGACVEAKKYGWLPSGGEMQLMKDNKEAVNAQLEALGGTQIGNGIYWTSQRYDNDYMWHMNMEDGTFAIWRGMVDQLLVRPVKSIEGYQDLTESVEE